MPTNIAWCFMTNAISHCFYVALKHAMTLAQVPRWEGYHYKLPLRPSFE